VDELPAPKLRPGSVLVRNVFSLISAGTERTVARVQRVKSYEVRSYITKKKQTARLARQTCRAAGGLREPATGAGRVRQELTPPARGVDRTQLRALL
jgi:hypothetical protein